MPFTPKPPVERLPLIVRKDIRDNYEPKRDEVAKKISETLKVDFKITIDPHATFAYADDGWAKNSHGQVLASYLDAFLSGFERMLEESPEDAVECFNEVVTKSELTLTIDETGKHSYVGCDVKDGVFRILFGQGYMGTNISDISYYKIPQAINDAPRTSDFPLLVRDSIRKIYDAQIGEVKDEIAKIVGSSDFTLDPNWLANYKAMKAYKDQSSWQEKNFGEVALEYFKGLQSQLEYQKFRDDEMMQEGLWDAVDERTFQLRIVDKLEKGSYNETVIKAGVAYIQTTPNYWYTNVSDACYGLAELL